MNSSLIRARVIEFDPPTVTRLQNRIREAIESGQECLPVEINSAGGDTYSLCGMVDAIEAAKQIINVATFCTGKAMSAGAVLLSCGTPGLRFASPNSTILIHQVSASFKGTMTELQVDTVETKRMNKQLANILGKTTGKGSQFFADKFQENKDWYLDARRAKALGLVDQVKLPLFLRRTQTDIVVG